MSRELADLPGLAAAIADIERGWPRRPWVLGLGGPHEGRVTVLNLVLGNAVLGKGDRDGECATLRVRRGARTRFIATRRDGTTETHALPAKPPHVDTTRIDAARGEHERNLAEVDRATAGLPRWLVSPRRGWRVVLSPFAWLWSLFHRRALRQHALAATALAAARTELDGAEHDAVSVDANAQVAHTRYFESLRALSSSSDVLEVVIELAHGPLPEDVELAERSPAVMIDAIVELERDALVAGGIAIGELATAWPALPAVLADARALRLARRTHDAAATALAALDERIDHAEADFSGRLTRLGALHIGDRAGFRDIELARVRPHIIASANAVIEHASVHLGAELAKLGDDWIGAIANATTSDELKTVTAHIEATGAASAHRIADETRILVSGGAAGSAHDLIPDVLAGLLPYGLPDDYVRGKRNAPKLPALELLPSLTQVTDAKLSGSALANLFRSFDTKRSDVRAKVHARIEHLREVAAAELLDVEPQLNAAIEHALDAALAAGLDAQSAWLETAIAAERDAIAGARNELAPIIARRDRARHELAELATANATFEAAHPATAAAAAAADATR